MPSPSRSIDQTSENLLCFLAIAAGTVTLVAFILLCLKYQRNAVITPQNSRLQRSDAQSLSTARVSQIAVSLGTSAVAVAPALPPAAPNLSQETPRPPPAPRAGPFQAWAEPTCGGTFILSEASARSVPSALFSARGSAPHSNQTPGTVARVSTVSTASDERSTSPQ